MSSTVNSTIPVVPLDRAPLTGAALPEGYVAGTRPVAIMVNNSAAAMPQRGIGSADILYEMVTEGGVTRLMAIFASPAVVPTVGPVRSARDQHLQMALPLNAIYVHIGSSIYASNLLSEQSYQDVDGMYLGSVSFAFDLERSKTRLNEHCWYTDAALIQAGVEKNAVPLTGAVTPAFTFTEIGAAARVPAAGPALHAKWQYSGACEVEFVYDAATASYLKTAYAAPHVDELTGAQLAFTNVLLLADDITLKSDGICTNFALQSGKGYYLSAGAYEEINWQKGAPNAPLILTDSSGAPLQVNVGKSYVGIIGKEQLAGFIANVVPAPPASSVPAAQPPPTA